MDKFTLNLLLVVVFLCVLQLTLLLLKFCGAYLSWVCVFAPTWGTILVWVGIPVIFSVLSKINNYIKSKKRC